jgi:phosphatidylglycerophosphatase C
MDHAYHYLHSRTHVQKEKNVKKRIAFFDFDGTITTKDTLLEFIKFSKGKFRFLLGFILNAHYLVAYKLKIISNQAAKEKMLAFFYQDMDVQQFRKLCEEFTRKRLPQLIRPKALDEIKKLHTDGFDIVVVSASPENWICHWAEQMQVKLIATKMEAKDGKLTGKIIGKNCHGEEKVRRIMEMYKLSDYEIVYAYGDTSGDRPMLKLAHTEHWRPFRN